MDHSDDLYKERMAALLKAVCATKTVKDDNVPSKIVEGLYLGSVGAANNKTLLKSLNITHILTVASSLPPAYPNDFTYKIVDVPDREEVSIAQFFGDCFGFINEAKRTGGVLVHCFVGRSRSVTIVVAYLMKKHGMSSSEALKLVKSKRSVAAPNSGFMLQLQNYQKSLSDMTQLPVLDYDENHNICAHLDFKSNNGGQVAGIIKYLLRSKIYHAVSHKPKVYRSLINEFWCKATYNSNMKSIVSSVQGFPVEVTPDLLQQVLHLEGESEDDPLSIKKTCVMGCFKRMKYEGNIGDGMYNKSKLSIQWKYLMHVLIHCLGPRKAGYDVLKETMQMMAVSLVLNKKFNIAKMIIFEMKEMIEREVVAKPRRPKKFLMYPRFVQMVLDHVLPNLLKNDDDELKLNHMDDDLVGRMRVYKGQKKLPEVKDLFGHIAKRNYQPPENDQWRNPDLDSENEDIDWADSNDDNIKGLGGDKGKRIEDSSKGKKTIGDQLLDEATESDEELSIGDESDQNKKQAIIDKKKQKETKELAEQKEKVAGEDAGGKEADLDDILLESEEKGRKKTMGKKRQKK